MISPLFHSGLWNTSICDQKLLISAAHHTFLESGHPEITKNLYHALSTYQRQIPIFLGSSSWTTNAIRPVKQNQLSFSNIEINKCVPVRLHTSNGEAAVVKSRKVLHANLIKIALHHRYFWNNLTKVQNSNIDKHITMVIYEDNYFCEHSWVAASQKQQRR